MRLKSNETQASVSLTDGEGQVGPSHCQFYHFHRKQRRKRNNIDFCHHSKNGKAALISTNSFDHMEYNSPKTRA
jgi:hypothetical protein